MLGLVARIGVAWVKSRLRYGLRDGDDSTAGRKKQAGLQTGMRGETYAYWYLRRFGYIFIAHDYMPSRVKGELDLVGFDGDTLAIVEVLARATHRRVSGSIRRGRHRQCTGATSCRAAAQSGAQPERAALPLKTYLIHKPLLFRLCFHRALKIN